MHVVAYVLWGCVVVSAGVLFFMIKTRDCHTEIKSLKKPLCSEETILQYDEVEKIPYRNNSSENKDIPCNDELL